MRLVADSNVLRDFTVESGLFCTFDKFLLVCSRTNTHRYIFNRHSTSSRSSLSLYASKRSLMSLPPLQTCTVWDISTGAPVTQLIAHDREVYDVAWSPASREVFASVGADGSVRMFDLRSLEHSTILYEASPSPSSSSTNSSTKRNGSTGSNPSPSATTSSSSSTPSPLLRLAFSPTSPNYLSVVHADSGDVQILDTRSPGTPAFEVKGHQGAVNGMAWGGETMQTSSESSGPGWLATVCTSNLLSPLFHIFIVEC